jgi:hypothetical protein
MGVFVAAVVAPSVVLLMREGDTVPKAQTTTSERRSTIPERTALSPVIKCHQPFSTDVPVLRVRADGAADCKTADTVLAQCADGSCDGEHINVGAQRLFCVTNQQRDTPALDASCTGPGQTVEWIAPPDE